MMHEAGSSRKDVPCCFSRSSFNFQGHTGQKIANFDLNGAFPDCNVSLNSPMALKWCTKLNVAKKMCPIVFQGHLLNFKVTRDNELSILTRTERFRTVTLVLIQQWLWNDAQSLKQLRKVVWLLFNVIHQISRSHGTKNCWFWPGLSVSDCNSSLNSLMALKRCTKLNVAKNMCPIVF